MGTSFEGKAMYFLKTGIIGEYLSKCFKTIKFTQEFRYFFMNIKHKIKDTTLSIYH